jgi:hypothetical protein
VCFAKKEVRVGSVSTSIHAASAADELNELILTAYSLYSCHRHSTHAPKAFQDVCLELAACTAFDLRLMDLKIALDTCLLQGCLTLYAEGTVYVRIETWHACVRHKSDALFAFNPL